MKKTIMIVLIALMCLSGCGRSEKIDEKGKQIIDNLLKYSYVWENNNIFLMSFGNGEDGINLYCLEMYKSSPSSNTGTSRDCFYSTGDPVECISKGIMKGTTLAISHDIDGWNTNWSVEKKRKKLEEQYIYYMEEHEE